MLVVSIWIERQYEVQATHVFEEVPQDRAAITTIMALKTLAKHVETQLGERAVCVVFEHGGRIRHEGSIPKDGSLLSAPPTASASLEPLYLLRCLCCGSH